MAKLICVKCGSKGSVPHVHDGPGVPSAKEPGKLVCPSHGEGYMPTEIPKCCGAQMKYDRSA